MSIHRWELLKAAGWEEDVTSDRLCLYDGNRKCLTPGGLCRIEVEQMSARLLLDFVSLARRNERLKGIQSCLKRL